jgi:hypothetical protein
LVQRWRQPRRAERAGRHIADRQKHGAVNPTPALASR